MISYMDAIQASRAKYAELMAETPQPEGYIVESTNVWHQVVAALKTMFAPKRETVVALTK